MKTFNAIMVVDQNDNPMKMELSEDIACGTTIGGVVVLFDEKDDAEVAYKNLAGLYSIKAPAKLVRVLVTRVETIGDVSGDVPDEDDE